MLRKKLTAIVLIITLLSTMTQAITVNAATNAKEVLNGATLNPIPTNYAPLDKLVRKVLKKYMKDDMNTYEKVKACYDYLIHNVSYSSNIFQAKAYQEIMSASYSSSWDKKVIYYAYCALKNKKESCYGYSSAFVVLTRAIGLESYVMQGKTALAKGGYGNHWWVNIKIDGKYYVFDPNVDENIAKGNTIYYYRFCKLDAEVPDKYIYTNRKEDINQFHEFQKGIPLKSIQFNKSKLTLYTGENQTLSLNLKPSDATVTAKTVWKSSNKKIATVSKSGIITAKKPGTVTISAVVGDKTTKCKVTVKKPFIKLNKTSITLKKVGNQSRLKTKVSPNLKESTIKWKSSNQKVVKVTENGEIIALSKGTATITAYIGKVKAKCKVIVKK
ncbi:Ig-like domain-containing protein [Candidatus Galacturonibacter soehngenii]|uniref:BIG2 domain-containing protein n=1 Tax=Candidatus Galacturonatibacter soehngenii TaxID=2307010 RepID=A0A7V7QKX7_9FIRM|nr:Ig-like domain-containing protein [Candidatus Galacturonibacter soehngenii]KAB1438517.1 hypothetical protein F7O84_13335 [Candidatus Galacturonibacter soehngenii]